MNGPESSLLQKGYRPNNSAFELTEFLGGGHFGAVWRAEHPQFGSAVFKFCLHLDSGRVMALRNELEKTVKLDHPGIVKLRGESLNALVPCLEYEFVDGKDLRRVLVGDDSESEFCPLTPNHAADVILKLVEIMAYVHSRPKQVVHRDLKPANILVTNFRDLQVLAALGLEPDLRLAKFKVMDFGLAAHARMPGQSQGGSTIGGNFDGWGTQVYMSPQQWREEPAHPSDDIFAIGVMWYELLSGFVEFGSPSGIRWQSEFQRKGMTDEQLKVLADCLEDDREHRIPNAVVLANRIHAAYTLEKPVDLFERVRQAINGPQSEWSLPLGNVCLSVPMKQPIGRKVFVDNVTSLSDEMRQFLANEGRYDLAFTGLTSLSLQAAQSIAESTAHQRASSVNLDSVKSLSTELAEVLADCNAWYLSLNALAKLTRETASALAKFKGVLRLNYRAIATPAIMRSLKLAEGLAVVGLTRPTKEIAQTLAEWEGKELILDMTSLTSDTALALVNWNGTALSLDELETLTPDVAHLFARWEGTTLSLNGLKTITLEVAQALAKWRGNELYLDGLETLTPPSAQALSKWNGESLSMSSLSKVTMAVVRALGRFGEDMDWGGCIDELEALTAEDAQTIVDLVGHDDLCLDGITTITPDIAHILTKYKGATLSLNGLTTLTQRTAQALSKWWGADWGMWSGSLSLNGLKSLSPEVAHAVARWEGNCLFLDGLETLTPDATQALSRWEGICLSLNGLKKLTPDVAQILAKWEGKRISAADLPSGPETDAGTDWRWLHLKKKSLSLEGIVSLTPEAAHALAKWNPPIEDCWGVGWLFLSGIETLSAEVASALSVFEHILLVNGVKVLAPKTALALANCRGFLVLDGVILLTKESAQALSTKLTGMGLCLDGLESLTPDVAFELAKLKGWILEYGTLKSGRYFLELQGLEPESATLWKRVTEKTE